ncbi:hypothetical protein [Acinetobacter courvalinii]|uniref:hypothetical protein n=1 Tax=Acinetobacter courvalinii TaxID=280147 RepID=UPI00289D78F3|nr:hypothetical protein [Acinetobacter courvalinii]
MKSTNNISYLNQDLMRFSPAAIVPSCMQITPDAAGVALMASSPYLGPLTVV